MERKEYIRLYRIKNKQRIREANQKYYQENKECRNEYDRKYRKENKEEIKESKRKYREENREWLKEEQRKRRVKYPWAMSYGAAMQRCTNPNNNRFRRYGGRGIIFVLTKEEIKQLWMRDKAYLMERPSIDRKNNNGHYEFKNCRFIELVKNSRKYWKERREKMGRRAFGITGIFMILVFVSSAVALHQTDARDKAETKIEQLEQELDDCGVATG